MKQTSNEKHSPAFLLDIRVRARHLHQGRISTGDVVSHINSLPDVETNGEEIGIAQPALSGEPEIDEPAPMGVS